MDEEQTLQSNPEPFVIEQNEFRMPKIGLDIQPTPTVDEPVESEVTRWDQVSAFVRRHELLYNNFRKFTDEFRTISEFHQDPDAIANFNPTEPYWVNQVPKHFIPQMMRTSSPGEFYRKLTQLRTEQEDDETIAGSSLSTMLAGGVLSGASNPLYWIPLAQGLRFPNILKSGVLATIKTVPKIATLEALSELNLHYTQESRTFTESVTNVVGTSILGGIFAGAGATYAALKPYRYKSLIKSHLDGEVIKFEVGPKGGESPDLIFMTVISAGCRACQALGF